MWSNPVRCAKGPRGVDNELFYCENTMKLSDAKKVAQELVKALAD
jgi:NAD/NADP transhydrogenase beta subunit